MVHNPQNRSDKNNFNSIKVENPLKFYIVTDKIIDSLAKFLLLIYNF